jgi:hypothetical protein
MGVNPNNKITVIIRMLFIVTLFQQLPAVAQSVVLVLLMHWIQEVAVLSFKSLARILQASPRPFPISSLPRYLHTLPAFDMLGRGVLPP